MYEMDFPVEEEELHVSMDGYSNMGSQKTRSFSISNKTMKYPPHHQDSKKRKYFLLVLMFLNYDLFF